MKTMVLQPDGDAAGMRLDAWLAGQIDGFTRSAAARLLEEGRVTCQGRTASKSCG